jgi:hypothetical protein
MDKDQIKLKVVAEEIKEILRKHDVAGAVALHTPGHGENFIHLNPSYSCAYMINDNEIRFYAKIADYKTPEEQQQKVADTSNMLKMLLDLSGINFMGLDQLSKILYSATGIKHGKLSRL